MMDSEVVSLFILLLWASEFITKEYSSSYPTGGEFSMRYRKRHELLLSQITEMIKGLYERFDAPCEEHRITLFAELIIAGAQHPEIREEEIIEIII